MKIKVIAYLAVLITITGPGIIFASSEDNWGYTGPEHWGKFEPKKFWRDLPERVGEKKMLSDISLSASSLLLQNRSYTHFHGSLTTPACSEGVNWMVMTTPVQASSDQVAAFAAIFPKNNRPVQPVNGRVVSLGN